ncbi:MAG: DUF4405 domain-containing protein [Tannerella sp.]|nr:DUF4405 domain-containing protein [Tannerella sp.]
MKTARKQSGKWRAPVSVSAFILFILLVLTAIVIETLEEVPYSVAAEAVYHVCTAIHVISGILFTVCGVFHIVYNRHTLKQYLKRRQKR